MNNLQVFNFEDKNIRIIIDNKNNPWFVGKDVASLLGYSNPQQAIRTHCKILKSYSDLGINEGAIFQHPIDLQTKFISEPDLYRLIVKSTKPEAEKFESWIMEDVLPTIRKTGGYSLISQTSNNKVMQASQDLAGYLNAASLLQCPLHLAQIESVKRIYKDTGVDFDCLLTYAPAQDNIKKQDEMLEPTELGRELKTSATVVNKILQDMGLQKKEGKNWIPTEKGEALSYKHAWKKGNKTGYNLKWKKQDILNMVEELVEKKTEDKKNGN